MLSALHAEFQKAHRRHDLAICLVVPVVVFLWTGRLTSNDPEELANAYSALLYALPVLNAILMPVVMALLASRLWDIEVKGSTTKLLYTLQSRRSLFAAKAAFGIGEVVLMVTLEMGAAVLLGCTQHYTEALPVGQLFYLGGCTLAVNVMLYLSELLLMLAWENPLPALCVSIVGALVGLFSAFMPPIVSYFVPWGYFEPLSAYEVAEWNRETHFVRYDTHPWNWVLLLFTAALGLAFFALAWRRVQREEV